MIDELFAVCMEAKQVRQPFKSVRDRATRPLKIIHTYISGPFEPETHDGKSYFMTVLDDYTHFCVVYLLSTKNEVKDCLKNYINQNEAQLNLIVSKIQYGNGGEYMNKAIVF